MSKDKFQNQSTGDSKQKATKGKKKKLEEYSAEELDAMSAQESGDLFAEAIVETLNDPANHDKSN